MLQQQDRWLWPFELTEKIGEGGMGVVYKARYVVNDKTVAVKILPADVTDETLLGRFEREVEILKTLRHPNIVYCFGGSCENKRRYYAMELVDGGTLDDLLKRRGRLPWELVVEYAKQMCAGLAYAHERGVVHRDVKPGNFLLTTDGKLKLSDFGLATLVAGRRVTAAGRTAGTYEYMAPEQITGKELSTRTDLYALGCVLFELLTGRPPFIGGASAEILHAHLKAPPPRVAAELPECPAALDRLICDLLQKNAADRPASATDVGAALKGITPSIVVSAGTPAGRVTNRPTTVPRRKSDPDEVLPDKPVPVAAVESSEWTPLIITAVIGTILALMVGLRDRGGWVTSFEEEFVAEYQQAETVRQLHGAEMLGRIAPYSSRALDTLKKGLQDPSPMTRRAAVIALRRAGAAAAPLLPQLKRMINEDDNQIVRIELSETIRIIDEARPIRPYWPLVVYATLFVEIGLGGWLAFRKLQAAVKPQTRQPA
jgi:serine/threonine-protein kinase